VGDLSNAISQGAEKNNEQLTLLKSEAVQRTITLVFGAKDEEHNEAILLQRLLKSS